MRASPSNSRHEGGVRPTVERLSLWAPFFLVFQPDGKSRLHSSLVYQPAGKSGFEFKTLRQSEVEAADDGLLG